MPRQCHYAVLLLLFHYFSGCLAQQNITVDDTNPSIKYNGLNWQFFGDSPLDVNNGHHVSINDSNANAIFTFTGTAVYFLSPKWPYPVGTQVQLDNESPVPLNLTDPDPTHSGDSETVQSAVVWSSGPIPNVPHTLTMTMSPIIQSWQFVVVDAIIYTIPASLSSSSSSPLPSPSSSPSPSPSPSPSATSSSESPNSTTQDVALSTNTSSSDSSSSSHHTLPIVLGTVLGVVGLLSIGSVAWLYCWRKKRPISEASTVAVAKPLLDPYSDTNYGGPSEDFNPWSGLPDLTHQQEPPDPQQQIPDGQQEPHSPVYATVTPFMATEKSILGTMKANQFPLGSPPASHPSVELSYDSPPLGRSVSVDQLSYASDLPPGAAAAGDPHQYPPSPTSLRGLVPGGASNVQPGNLKLQKGSSLVAVNRTDDEQEDLVPPAYSL